MMTMKNNLDKNSHGYSDPVACKAIRVADKPSDKEETKRVTDLLGLIFTICRLSGFHVEERIVLKDMRTGKIWR